MSKEVLVEKISERTCVACRKKAARTELLRFVLQGDGESRQVAFDKSKRRPGRGVWTHSPAQNVDCFERALEEGFLARGLRAPRGVQSNEVVTNLRRSVALYLAQANK